MAGRSVRQYDPAAVILTVDDQNILGYADGSFVNIARNNDLFTLTVGADGEATRSKSNDLSGRITITLQQTSPSNDILSALADADEQSNQGVFAVQLKDASGQTLGAGERAWVVKKADAPFAKETENREWIIETNELVYTVGGNVVL